MALVYVILSTLPCFAFLIASSEVQHAVNSLPFVSFVLIALIYLCSDPERYFCFSHI